MNLRICLTCGCIWDNNDAYGPSYTCHICRVNKRPDDNVRELGQVILELRRSNLIHHGKLKGLP